jgi:hypothetical protein
LDPQVRLLTLPNFGVNNNQIFSRGIKELTLPLIHVGALTKSISPPQVTKTQVLTKSTRSPSPKRWVKPCTQRLSWGSYNLKSSPRTLKIPRPSRSHQSPRVTSPHTLTWPEHSAKPWYAPWNPLSLRKSSPNKRKMNPKWAKHYLLLSLDVVDLLSGKGSSRDAGGSYV